MVKAEELNKELLTLKNTQKDLELIAVNPSLAQKQMKICEICGAKQAINDIEKRNLTHLDGKLHKGFATIRKEIDRLKLQLEKVILQIEVMNEKKRKEGLFLTEESESEKNENFRKKKIDKSH